MIDLLAQTHGYGLTVLSSVRSRRAYLVPVELTEESAARWGLIRDRLAGHGVLLSNQGTLSAHSWENLLGKLDAAEVSS